MIPDDDERVVKWVRERLDELDTTPRNRNWRNRALGMTKAEAAALAPRDVVFTLHVPVGEMRLINDAARRRDLAPARFVRLAIGTILVVCDGLPQDAMTYLLDGGLIGPR